MSTIINTHPKSCLAAFTLLYVVASSSPDVPTSYILPLTYNDVPATYVAVDPKQQDCLAANIYYEGRNQPQFGQLAIGLTTIVRAKNSQWPDSVCAVVKQPRQFSWVGKTKRGIKWDDPAYLSALSLSGKILSGDYDNLLPLFSPTYFHTTKVNPKWNKHLDKLITIKDHIFYE